MSLGVLIAVIILLILVTNDKKPAQTATVTEIRQDEAPTVVKVTEGFTPENGVNYAGVARENDDWSEKVKGLSLDPSVATSHRRFVEERLKVSSGAEKKPELDHMININSWVGLRRPDYTKNKESENSRVVSSIDFESDDLVKPRRDFRF
jgi:hypothetical protein